MALGLPKWLPWSRDKPKNRLGAGFSFLFGGTPSGKTVNEHTAMQSTAVYACVRILSEAVASLPLHVYRYKSDGDKERAPEHPLYTLLHNAVNPEITSFIFRELIMSHLLLWGNSYSQVIRDGRGRVMALYPLLPNKMEVSRGNDGELIYTYQRDSDEVGKNAGGTVVLRRHEVLHIPGLGFDGLIGYSPIAMARNAIGMSLATEEFGARFYANSANPSGVLEHPSTLSNPESIRESWHKQFSGDNRHNIAVLQEGMKFHPISIPPEQAQFLESRKFQLNEIARIFRIPPHFIGDLEKSSFSNIENMSLNFVKYTLDPWIVRLEQSFQQSLLLPNEKHEFFIRFNVDGLLRGDYQSRVTGYSIGIQNGFYCPDDIRNLEDLNAIPDGSGKTFMTNGNMIPLSMVGQQYVKNIVDLE
ncbi:portal protein [Clostridia bacterium]|nr:portal protein [Clostridia bacterium]